MRGIVLLVIFINLALLAPLVQGDGVPIMHKTLQEVTHENRQLAVIDVHGDYEVMHLFLSVVSLDPGNNITILIPVRTVPKAISVSNTSESEFMYNHNLSAVKETHDGEMFGMKRAKETYFASTFIFTTSSLVIPFAGLYLVYMISPSPMGAGGSAGGGEVIHFQTGDSAMLYNFTTYEDVENIYQKYNLSLPQNVNETLHRYSSFHLIALNMKTRAPIAEDKYEILREKCPQTMALLNKYVAEHPRVNATVVGDGGYHYGYGGTHFPDFERVEEEFNKESKDNYTLRNYFCSVVYSIYGYGKMHGIELSVSMPLYEGKAFYPLGTSPAWNSSGKIRVWFRIPDNKDMNFNVNPDYMVRYRGFRYYYWNFDSHLPDFDIEGTPKSKDIGTAMSDESQNMALWMVRNGEPFGFIMGLVTAIAIWFFILLGFVSIYPGREILHREKKFKCVLFASALLAVFVSGIVAVLLVYRLAGRNNEKNKRSEYALAYITIFILTSIPLFLLWFFGFSPRIGMEGFIIAILFGYGLLGLHTAVVLGGEKGIKKLIAAIRRKSVK